MSDNEEQQEPKVEDSNAPINIKVLSSTGEEVFFKIKKNTKLTKLQGAYANKVGKDVNNIRFLYDGERINEDDTPASLGMIWFFSHRALQDDGDAIDVMVQQVGGSDDKKNDALCHVDCDLPSERGEFIYITSYSLGFNLKHNSTSTLPTDLNSHMAAARRAILVVAGIGNGSGTGASSARLFAKNGYQVALLARNADYLKKLADEINADGGQAEGFPVKEYSFDILHDTFSAIKKRFSDGDIRVGIYNAGFGVWKPFLDVTPEDLQKSLDSNITGAFAFSREIILALKQLPPDENRVKGTLIFTGATASTRGNVVTSAFASGKFALRALSQSLAKEFGKEDIHINLDSKVAHSIIDGGIITDRVRERRNDPEWEANEAVRLAPESIAKSYLYLAQQDRSAWTWELDLRPAHEKW
ncbi:hypothetical protein Clacol_008429 [Clathrus columnatus]|uniref:Ubiquitin-like domain-containing protein n=1 Tax=Clathrus columnatus TaxID=1419009 RepID=A0AAV5AM63_9AGAM|nr:hypothetical protein Clacol_008429 [Clathrus columnatus]